MRQRIPVPVEPGAVFSRVPHQLDEADVGSRSPCWPWRSASPCRRRTCDRVNLLRGHQTGPGGPSPRVLVLIGAAVVIGVIILLLGVPGVRLNGVNDDIGAGIRPTPVWSRRSPTCRKYEDAGRGSATGAAARCSVWDEVAYSSILVDVSMIPPDTYLTSFSSTIDTTAVPSSDPTAHHVRWHDDVRGSTAALRLAQRGSPGSRTCRAGPTPGHRTSPRKARPPGRSPSTHPST